jgi:hypothetical protein
MYPHHVAAGRRTAAPMPIRDLIFYDFEEYGRIDRIGVAIQQASGVLCLFGAVSWNGCRMPSWRRCWLRDLLQQAPARHVDETPARAARILDSYISPIIVHIDQGGIAWKWQPAHP